MADDGRDGSWLESDSESFIDWGQYFVPYRNMQIRIVCDMVPTAGPGEGYVELCCGEGRLSEALLQSQTNARVLALDGSAAMQAATRERLAPFGDRAEVAEFDIMADDWRRLPFAPLAVVSSLAVHHLDGGQKRHLFGDMYRARKPGGRLIIADLIETQSDQATAIAAWSWDRTAREAARAHKGAGDPYQEFVDGEWNYYASSEPDPIDKPSSLLAQLNWLEDVGFVEVDVHWLLAGHAIFSGRKGD